MTRAEWDARRSELARQLIMVGRYDGQTAAAHSIAMTETRYGPRPDAEPKTQMDEQREERVSTPLWTRLLGPIVRVVVGDKFREFLNRYAVLISVVYLALLGLLEGLKQAGMEWASVVETVLKTIGGLLAISPSADVSAAVLPAVASAFALYGGIRKIISLVKPKE